MATERRSSEVTADTFFANNMHKVTDLSTKMIIMIVVVVMMMMMMMIIS
jgi:hypothetical protein